MEAEVQVVALREAPKRGGQEHQGAEPREKEIDFLERLLREPKLCEFSRNTDQVSGSLIT